jgi:hypothetical protein
MAREDYRNLERPYVKNPGMDCMLSRVECVTEKEGQSVQELRGALRGGLAGDTPHISAVGTLFSAVLPSRQCCFPT